MDQRRRLNALGALGSNQVGQEDFHAAPVGWKVLPNVQDAQSHRS